MTFGALQASKSYRQLYKRSATRTPPAGRGQASLVLGSDAVDETAVLQVGDQIVVETTGLVNDAKRLEVRGIVRVNQLPPAGYAWAVRFTVAAVSNVVVVSPTLFGNLNVPVSFNLNDIAPNVTGLAGVQTISFQLELITDPFGVAGPLATDVAVTLPSVYIDQVLAPEVIASDLYVTDRGPAPAATGVVNTQPTIAFTLADTTGTGVDLTNTTITVDGVVAYTAGAFVLPWAGTVTPGIGPTGNDVRFVMTVPAADLPYASEQVVEINVDSELTGAASPIDVTWSFTAADNIKPALQRANMISKKVLRITFTDDVLLDTSAAGALNPDNYTLARVSVPAVRAVPVSVEAVVGESNAVDITFDIELSQAADYTLYAKDVVDDAGNVIDPEGSNINFKGFVPPKPIGRRFELLDHISAENLQRDLTTDQGGCETEPGSGDLRRLLLVLQDLIDLLLCEIDEWTQIIDIDLAPEPFLDAILQDLGNPFVDCIADLTVNDKRRLARILISIYKQKGTDVGVINAIRFFLGIETTLDIINCRQFWQLNVSQLDLNTILAPPVGDPLWYSFYVVSPVVLTEEQRTRILCIAEYMKGAHEHVLGVVEPGGIVTASNFWILNQSLLGANPNANPSTILA